MPPECHHLKLSSEPDSSPAVAPKFFTDAESALAYVRTIYDGQVRWLADRFEDYATGKALTGPQRAFYPYVQLTTSTHSRLDSRLSYGFVRGPGVFRASLTRPDLFEDYYREQVDQHLQIGIRSLEILRDSGLERLHSRRLRSFVETGFR